VTKCMINTQLKCIMQGQGAATGKFKSASLSASSGSEVRSRA